MAIFPAAVLVEYKVKGRYVVPAPTGKMYVIFVVANVHLTGPLIMFVLEKAAPAVMPVAAVDVILKIFVGSVDRTPEFKVSLVAVTGLPNVTPAPAEVVIVKLTNVIAPAPDILQFVLFENITVLVAPAVKVPSLVKFPEILIVLNAPKLSTPPELIVIAAHAELTFIVIGDPLTIVTISPATGTCAGDHEPGAFQLPPAPVEEILAAYAPSSANVAKKMQSSFLAVQAIAPVIPDVNEIFICSKMPNCKKGFY